MIFWHAVGALQSQGLSGVLCYNHPHVTPNITPILVPIFTKVRVVRVEGLKFWVWIVLFVGRMSHETSLVAQSTKASANERCMRAASAWGVLGGPVASNSHPQTNPCQRNPFNLAVWQLLRKLVPFRIFLAPRALR